jgi:tetratricopeptide (TPR) repeat protein
MNQLLPIVSALAFVVLTCNAQANRLTDGHSGPVTFNRDVAPILHKNCAICHRPGSSGPFSLLTYADVIKRARQIEIVTEKRFMPPWLPEPNQPRFENERRLTEEQIQTISKWVNTGKLEGNPSDLPPAPTFSEGWQLGTPDLIVEMPEPYLLAADGEDVYRHFVIPVPVETERWVKAMEFQPGNPRIAHHALMDIDRTQVSKYMDEQDPEVGFDGMLNPDSLEKPGGVFANWNPGRLSWAGADDIAWRLTKNTSIVVQVHMQKTGKPESIQSRVGLYFANKPPTRFPIIIGVRSMEIDIPAGTNAHRVTNSYALPVDVALMAISPHAHYLAQEMQAYAMLPDGTRKSLLRIQHWNFNRQEEYRYTEPVALPKGTTVVMDYVYDNSADNLQNPNHPPKRVRYGLQTKDEMAEFMMQVLPRSASDRALLNADFAKHVREQNAKAITRWAELEPDDLGYQAAFARLCAGDGRLEEAEKHFRFVLERDPKLNEVRFSYANLLMQSKRYSEATEQCKAIIETVPNFLRAHNLLGLIALNLRQYTDAEAHFRRCLVIQPDYRVPLGNLGQALASQGKLDEAEKYFREMLRLDPDDARAIKYLNLIAKRRREKAVNPANKAE